jgi:DNA recombination protein RmuC
LSSEALAALLIGLLAGLVLAGGVAFAIARSRLAAALAAGRAAREPELVALARDLDAARREGDALRQAQAEGERERGQQRERLERLGEERVALAARAERLEAAERQLAQRETELQAVRGARQVAESRCAELGARLEEQQQAAGARYRELELARERLKAEFQALASEILEDKSKRFGESQQAQLGQLLDPLREQLGDFRRAVSDAYEKENNARVALQTRIDDLVRLNQTLGQEAQTLSRALSSDNRSQGYWGELKLERLLESAGLEKGQQYLTQESFRDSDGDRYRPDALLRLPEGKDIVIDAKMVLIDYQRACESGDAGEREQHMTRHVTALRTHVRQLGEKDYSRLEGVNSPDLVMLFVPVEGAFLDALRRDPSLYEYAFERKIILVGPSNLLASLRLVSQLWRTEQQNRNAKAIADRAALLYDKFVGFTEDLAKVGDALERAHLAQRAAIAKLSQGRGNLVRQAEQLRQLGVAPTKRLAGPLLDPAEEPEAAGADPEPDADPDPDPPAPGAAPYTLP